MAKRISVKAHTRGPPGSRKKPKLPTPKRAKKSKNKPGSGAQALLPIGR